MEVLTKAEVIMRQEEIIEKIQAGALFIYPTDTIYGMGCNASNKASVEKMRKLKTARLTSPFSIIVPTLDWIKKNCSLSKNQEKWLEKLPGPLTLIIPLKNKKVIAPNVAPNIETIGIRYPDTWFMQILEKANVPLITTSVNKTGEKFMTTIEQLDQDLEIGMEFAIYEGAKEGRPSKIINVQTDEVKER